MIGTSGSDTLDGRLGSDTLAGGAGNDVYLVDGLDDVIVEIPGQGSDSVHTTLAAYSLASSAANVEHLVYTAAADFAGSGSDAANSLVGGIGKDTLAGLGGIDTLIGDAGDDTLDGGLGGDRLDGGGGDDLYYVDNAFDRIVDADGAADTVRVSGLAAWSLGSGIENLVVAGSGACVGNGNGAANRLDGGDGNDTLNGAGGDDTLDGGGGRDILRGGDGDDLLLAGSGDDRFEGGSGNDSLDLRALGWLAAAKGAAAGAGAFGVVRPDATTLLLTGADGQRLTLKGSWAAGGSDRGIENFVFADATVGLDALLANTASRFADTFVGGAGDDSFDGAAGNDTVAGGGGNDTLFGGSGNDTFDGGAGDDTLSGGIGNDVYGIDSAGDLIVELAGEGNDAVVTTLASFDLGADNRLERLLFSGSGAFTGNGNDLANQIAGGDGNDRLNGFAGADTLIGGGGSDRLDGGSGADLLDGGAGDDTLIVDNLLDRVVDSGGNDTVRVFGIATYTLPAAIENLLVGSASGVAAAGNGGNNILVGGVARDTLSGLGGDDFLDGGAGRDLLNGGLGDDTLFGGDGDDTLRGGDLAATVGTDVAVFAGKPGDYTITRLTDSAINARIRFSRSGADGVESDTLVGIEAVIFTDVAGVRVLDSGDLLRNTGSAFADTYVDDDDAATVTGFDGGNGNDVASGGARANTLLGGAGNDTLGGGGGNDSLDGGSGNDTLDGGSGDDTLVGGSGDDVHVVDSTLDTVGELAGQGRDTVRTTLAAYSLANSAANVERLEFIGNGDFAGTGNELANVLVGGSGKDTLAGGAGADQLLGAAGNDSLDGGAGADRLDGGDGDDVYYVDNALDLLVDSGGSDSVHSLIGWSLAGGYENLVLDGIAAINGSGNAGANQLTGNAARNTLNGGLGDDTLTGGGGNDLLLGGAGSDVAAFAGPRSGYAVGRQGSSVVVEGQDGRDLLSGIEVLSFDGVTIDVELAIATSVQPVSSLPADVIPALFGGRWNAAQPLGTGVTLTYSFMTAIPPYDFFAGIGHPGFRTMNTAERNAVRDVLDQYSRIINVNFVEVADNFDANGDGDGNDFGDGGKLRFGTDRQSGSSGYAFLPTDGLDGDGDVWINNDPNLELSYAPGEFGLSTLIHEIGHALGLKHPFEGASRLAPATENTRYTVMSYTDRSDDLVGVASEVDGVRNSSVYGPLSPETPMPYDIGVLQYLYGARSTASDDVYAPPADRAFFQAVADGGGSDTLDCSAFSRQCVIDLRPGAYSSLGRGDTALDLLPEWFAASLNPTYAGHDNLAIAFGTVIENARGGSGNDALTGNLVGNVLDGGAGNDLLTGGAGNDFFVFSSALDGVGNVDTLTDFLGGSDGIRLAAAVFGGLAAGALAADAFAAGAGLTQAQDAGDRIVFDSLGGGLYFDADGSGGTAAVRFAVLSGQATIAATDFSII